MDEQERELGPVAEKLLEVEQEIVDFEFGVKGATRFPGGKDVEVGEVVSISMGARCVAKGVETRTRTVEDEDGEKREEEYLVKRTVLKATGARIK